MSFFLTKNKKLSIKLGFESLELTVNHESINNRSTDADYYYSENLMLNLQYDSGIKERNMQIRGIYDINDYDSSGLTENMIIERGGNTFEKNGVKMRKYNFISPINHGVARDGCLLPPGIRYRLCFARAKPERSLLLIGSDKDLKYDDRAVLLLNPQLNLVYISSHEIDNKINRLKAHGLAFSNYPICQYILTEGLAEYNITLSQGIKF